MNSVEITSLIVAAVSILSGLILFIANSRSRVIRAWFAESISVFLWSLALFGVTSRSTEVAALRWQYLLDISAVFTPVLYYNFISVFLNTKNKLFIKFSLGVAAILALFTLTPYFKLGVEQKYGFFWIVPGTFYFILPAFFILYTVFTLFALIKTIVTSSDPILRRQVLILFWGFLIGSIGGITNFFPQLFNIYPYGNFAVIVYFFFMGYAIIRFEFLDVKIISFQVFSSLVVLATLFNLLRSITLQDWYIGLLAFTLSISFSILLIRSIKKEVEMKERLKELDELKSEFTSLATHHISTPLTAIKGYVSLLQEGNYEESPVEKAKTLSSLERLTDNLVTIIRDFLDVSRIESGEVKYTFSHCNFFEIVNEVIKEYSRPIERKGLKLVYTHKEVGGCMIYVDREKIKLALSNIFENALKYTSCGFIEVEIFVTNTSVLVQISDTGVRNLPSAVPKLFSKFTKSSNENEAKIIGNGLGLYVAKQHIEAHKGRMWIETEEGKGSSFFVELPRA